MATLDVVSLVRKLIHDRLGVRVPATVPDPRPTEFVLVRREGGRRRDALVDVAGVGIECWAQSDARARELSDEVSDLMLLLHHRGFSLGIDSSVEEVRRSDPDVETETPRWYASYTLVTHNDQPIGG